MKLYVGSADYRPEGYKTVDIDPARNPDFVADITKLAETVPPESCDEIVAGHVLEHIEWPDSFRALAQFHKALKQGGTLKVAVPDMGLLCRMLLNSGASDFAVMSMIYGGKGRENAFEKHRYGFTAGMLIDILETLGFADFDWWNAEVDDASKGWMSQSDGRDVAMSLNVACVKVGEPRVDPESLFAALASNPTGDFLAEAATTRVDQGLAVPSKASAPRLYQQIHMQLIESRQRARHLAEKLREMETAVARKAPARKKAPRAAKPE